MWWNYNKIETLIYYYNRDYDCRNCMYMYCTCTIFVTIFSHFSPFPPSLSLHMYLLFSLSPSPPHRYDIRNHFDDKAQFGIKPSLPHRPTDEEEALEAQLDEERYLALGQEILEEDLGKRLLHVHAVYCTCVQVFIQFKWIVKFIFLILFLVHVQNWINQILC